MKRATKSRAVRIRDEEKLWTKRDVAALLNVDVRTVEGMAIPRVRLPATGKKPIVRFDPVQVRAWIEAQKTRPRRASATMATAG